MNYKPYQRYGFYLAFLFTLLFSSQLLLAQTQKDSLHITAAVMDYLEGLEYNDSIRVKRALHPDLAKRVISTTKNGEEKLDNMTAATLLHYTKTFDYTKLYKEGVDPELTLKVEVTLYDLDTHIATVKASQNKFAFFDYIHLGKINGDWKIINILWAWTE